MKRAAVFVFYEKNGIVDRNVEYYLAQLRPFVTHLLVVVNGSLTEEGKSILWKFADEIVVRENIGYDVAAFQTGIRTIGYEKLGEFDELLMVNDSVFGPVFPLNEMFKEMEERRKVDFWGVTGHRLMKNIRLQSNPCGYMPAHIQSYFMVFSQSVLKNQCFKEYWEELPIVENRNSAIERHETYVTYFFEHHGFSWDTYVPMVEDKGHEDMVHAEAVRTLLMFQCPLVKKNLFTMATCFPEAVSELYEAIREQTEYDETMIAEYALRRLGGENAIRAIPLLMRSEAQKDGKSCRLRRRQKIRLSLKKKLLYRVNRAEIIRRSKFFNAVWYEKTYQIPRKKAAEHYLQEGFLQGYHPSCLFHGEEYLKANPDVRGMNPLLHYEVWGKRENRPLR